MSVRNRPLYLLRFFSVTLCLCALLFPASRARAQDFLKQVNVEPLETVEVQDQLTLKTFDSYARQQLVEITGKTSLDGVGAIPTILDMAFRPEAWENRNVIRVKNAVLRREFGDFKGIDAAEKDRILKQGTVSLAFLKRPDVQAFLEDLSGQAVFKSNAIGELQNAAMALVHVEDSGGFLPSAPFPPGAPDDRDWKTSAKIRVNVPRFLEAIHAQGGTMAKPLPGYDGKEQVIAKVLDAQVDLADAWRDQKVDAASAAVVRVAELLPQVNPDVYPAMAKRRVEVYYNRLAQLTIPGAFVYIAGMTLYLMGIYSDGPRLKLWGRRMFTLAFVVHTLAIGVRWWLVSHSVGNWFEGIPIKNQFESVMFSVWFGAAVALFLEYFRWGGGEKGLLPMILTMVSRIAVKGRGIWGAAACFVGWLGLVAIFAAPYVAGRDIGGNIHMVTGVLMSYWLYIHVTMVTASYALISMSFALGCWWIIKYLVDAGTIGAGGHGGGAMLAGAGGDVPVGRAPTGGPSLEFLDQCNLVILQLAFWVLGVGIVLGAVWADQSWGRPWGWDPKETFALVTWIIYLAVVHIRMATAHKAWWTAVLSVVGFFVMLFNWIGVNFFLVGLHSYA